VAVNYPGEFAHIAAIGVHDGSLEKICRVKTPALYYVSSVTYDESTGTIFFTTNNGKYWRDLNSVNVDSGEVKELLRNFRTGDLCFNASDKSIWGVQHHNGISSLVRIAPPYNDWNLMSQHMLVPFGKDIFDLDISPDGNYLTCSMIEITGRARLVRMKIEDLMVGDPAYEVLYEFNKTAPANFVFSRDGRHLYGTAYQTGVSNVFRWDFASETIEAVSNCESGYFRPCYVSEDSLIVLDYSGHGLMPVMIPIQTTEDIAAVRYLGNEVAVEHPIVRDWKLGSPRDVNLDSVMTYRGDYGKWRNFGLASAYPTVDQYKGWTAIGLRFNLMDPVGLHSADFKLGGTFVGNIPDEERVHALLEYSSWPWTLTAGWNRSDFYDFFGPTLRSRKGYLVTLEYKNYFIADKPRYLEYDIFLGQFGKLDEVPFAQGIPATYDQYTSGRFNLEYRNTGKTIGSVDQEQGIKMGATYAGNYVKDRFYSQVAGYGHYGIRTPLTHSSIWLRGYAGYSWGDPDDTFANFYFGAFGNNYVDHLSVQRYRDYYSFPGVEITSLGGTNFGKFMLEWTLPPARFERFGIPAVYITWMRTALFTSGIVTSFDSEARQRELVNLGGQVDFRLVWMSGLNMTLSLGYAAAWEQEYRPESEFMISLKIL
jgi:hypothetical protein